MIILRFDLKDIDHKADVVVYGRTAEREATEITKKKEFSKKLSVRISFTTTKNKEGKTYDLKNMSRCCII